MDPRKARQADGRSGRTAPVLTPDLALRLPEFVLLKASAGSGKTHALSLRFVQFLLSDDLRSRTWNALGNILAITFTRNSAREMKERVLAWLKNCRFADAGETAQVQEIVSVPAAELPGRAERALENIIADYSDFQVETIDSFMASIFRASAVDLDQSPDFEIVIDSRDLVEYAFSRYMRKVFPGSPDGELFGGILDHLLANQGPNSSFAWDPAPQVLDRLASLYAKLAAEDRDLEIEDFSGERSGILDEITRAVGEMESLISGSALERNLRSGYNSRILSAIRDQHFADLLRAKTKIKPVKKPRVRADAAAGEAIETAWEALGGLVNRYKANYARGFFYPYLLAFRSFAGTLELVKRVRGTVFIEDIGKQLAAYIDQGIVPDIYFRLGDRIFHFLIDEFQDTSPIQWKNMVPLIENSLAQGGSLFVVGDTKQAIYGFRNADYRIMKNLEDGEPVFESTTVDVRELKENYRCRGAILDFVKKVFLDVAKGDKERAPIAGLSGLDEWTQEAVTDPGDSGYVRYSLLEKTPAPRGIDDAGPDEAGRSGETGKEGKTETPDGIPETSEASDEGGDGEPEKERLQKTISELIARGYSFSDITVLTYKNENVARAAAWLNEAGIPFIPYSSLDIRKRKIIAETLRFLEFLDSPPDDLAFASFLTGDLFRTRLERDGCFSESKEWDKFLFEHRAAADRPLYIAFRGRFPEVWDRYFEPFFKTVGYYPLYDLVTQIFRTFDVFRLFAEEEAALVKLLETIKNFEGEGRNDLRGFLEMSGDGETADPGWTIDVPSDIPAVKIMSIHKAKGLGFPVVILLIYGDRWKAPDLFLSRGEDGVRALKITADFAEADPELGEVYRDTQARDKVNQMNTLYVALTRAQAELYIIGVKGKTDSYPFDLLDGAAARLIEEGSWVECGEGTASAAGPPTACPKKGKPIGPPAEKHRFTGLFELPPNPRVELNYSGIRRGEIAHAIMAGLEYSELGWEEDVRVVLGETRPPEPDVPLWEEVGAAIVRYFRESQVRGLFEKRKGRKVLREAEFCDAAGRVFRMDRVVVDEDLVTVLDYKTGVDPDPARRAAKGEVDRGQVRWYAAILQEVFPGRNVRATLARIDEGTSEDVI